MTFLQHTPTENELHHTVAAAHPTQRRQITDQLARNGTPLLDSRRDTALFVWDCPDEDPATPTEPYLWVNRLTDKADFPRGLMHRIPGTTLWTVELPLSPTARHSYGFLRVPVGTTTAPGPPRIGPGGMRLDPWNKLLPVVDHGDGYGTSCVHGAAAPPQPHWESAQHGSPPRGQVRRVDGDRRWHLYLPPTPPQPGHTIPVLSLFDGVQWFAAARLPDALDRAIAAGECGPLAVLGISPLPGRRIADMADPHALLDALCNQALPWAHGEIRRLGHQPAAPGGPEYALAGESLGGYVCLRALTDVPGVFGTFLAQSPSTWASPVGGSPADLEALSRPCWTARRLAAASVVAAQSLTLTIGSREATSHPHLADVRRAAAARGVPVTVREIDGGHDLAWWRGELLSLAARLTGRAPV